VTADAKPVRFWDRVRAVAQHKPGAEAKPLGCLCGQDYEGIVPYCPLHTPSATAASAPKGGA